MGTLRGVNTSVSLKHVLSHYRKHDWAAHLAVCTGDIVHDDSAKAYRRFRKRLRKLDIPVACIPGNHDVPSLMRDELSQPPFSYCPDLEYGNWLLASVDTCVPGKAGGSVNEQTLARLQRSVDASSTQHVFVFMHHPPVSMDSAWLDSVGLENAESFMQLIKRMPNVRAIAFGHVHQIYDRDHDGIRVLGTPSTCRQFKPRQASFEVDDNPPAYRRLELGPDGSIQTELIWVNRA